MSLVLSPVLTVVRAVPKHWCSGQRSPTIPVSSAPWPTPPTTLSSSWSNPTPFWCRRSKCCLPKPRSERVKVTWWETSKSQLPDTLGWGVRFIWQGRSKQHILYRCWMNIVSCQQKLRDLFPVKFMILFVNHIDYLVATIPDSGHGGDPPLGLQLRPAQHVNPAVWRRQPPYLHGQRGQHQLLDVTDTTASQRHHRPQACQEEEGHQGWQRSPHRTGVLPCGLLWTLPAEQRHRGQNCGGHVVWSYISVLMIYSSEHDSIIKSIKTSTRDKNLIYVHWMW